MNLADLALSQSANAGDAIAIQMQGESMSYHDLASESDRVAAGLRAMGVTAGDRVMLFAENRIEYLVLYLASARLGAIFTPVHPSFQGAELEYVLRNAAPAVVVAEKRLWKRLERYGAPWLPGARIVLGGDRKDMLPYSGLGWGEAAAGVLAVAEDTPVLVCYTSGTTDRPHPVTRSHGHEIWNARAYWSVLDFRPGDRALIALPLSWVWGLSTLSQALLSGGASVVLHREFAARRVLEEIESTGITLFAGTMSMYGALLGAVDESAYDLSSLRHLYRGGEPINAEVVGAVERRLGHRLIEAYATTEVAPVLAVDPVRDPDAPAGSAGRLVDGARLRIVNENGEDVEVGEVGEGWVGGAGVMLGYWGEPELTAERLVDGWFHTGDLLYEDDHGYYYVVGRSVDVIIRDGAKIAPAEVESALAGLPGVRESAVVGIPDDEFGQSIVAFVRLEPDCIVSVDDVYAHLADRIARFKLPSEIHFVDQLPVRRNQKRDRASIRYQAMILSEHAPPSALGAMRSGRPRLRVVE
ncbi:class I adenylate-forming enzyme family protein [Salinibacterium sp. ZJ450]|uniref:class I adenylate-forming enzyme family protein n=1 Tax=Salinibacterium sp. ZJ450 TaxID=2708338 RepID=UPI0014217DEE|nr:class I adenylate-forming enzyme family protein [Salinibacterium sp. ZJ450]